MECGQGALVLSTTTGSTMASRLCRCPTNATPLGGTHPSRQQLAAPVHRWEHEACRNPLFPSPHPPRESSVGMGLRQQPGLQFLLLPQPQGTFLWVPSASLLQGTSEQTPGLSSRSQAQSTLSTAQLVRPGAPRLGEVPEPPAGRGMCSRDGSGTEDPGLGCSYAHPHPRSPAGPWQGTKP